LVLHLLLPPMVAWQLRVAQTLFLFATAVCHEVAVVTPSQFDSVIESFLLLCSLGRKTASTRGQVKSTPQSQPPSEEDLPRRRDDAGRRLALQKHMSVVGRFDMLLTARGRTQFNSSIYPAVRNASIRLPLTIPRAPLPNINWQGC
jgi:hypothetical protein